MYITLNQAPAILFSLLVAGFFWGIGNAAAKGLLELMARYRPQLKKLQG